MGGRTEKVRLQQTGSRDTVPLLWYPKEKWSVLFSLNTLINILFCQVFSYTPQTWCPSVPSWLQVWGPIPAVNADFLFKIIYFKKWQSSDDKHCRDMTEKMLSTKWKIRMGENNKSQHACCHPPTWKVLGPPPPLGCCAAFQGPHVLAVSHPLQPIQRPLSSCSTTACELGQTCWGEQRNVLIKNRTDMLC